MSTKRLFFALWPDSRQRDRMRDFISPVARLVDGMAIVLLMAFPVTFDLPGTGNGLFLAPELLQIRTTGEIEPPRQRQLQPGPEVGIRAHRDLSRQRCR